MRAPLVLCLVAVVALSGCTSSTRHEGKPSVVLPALTCQAQHEHHPGQRIDWRTFVPAKPSGIDGRGRLLPIGQVPSVVTLCRYGKTNVSRVIRAGLAAFALAMEWAAPHGRSLPCADSFSTRSQDRWLIGVRYQHGGVAWIFTTDQCGWLTTNGVFLSDATFGGEAAEAFRSGRWPAETFTPGQCPVISYRFGQQTALVPRDPTSLTFCDVNTRKSTKVLTTDFTELVQRLDSETTRVSEHGCTPLNGDKPTASYSLVFGYPTGPPVVVDIEVGCRPELDNWTLQARDTRGAIALVSSLGR